jgi:DNA-directed RNA polymerase specialized sigma subunit
MKANGEKYSFICSACGKLNTAYHAPSQHTRKVCDRKCNGVVLARKYRPKVLARTKLAYDMYYMDGLTLQEIGILFGGISRERVRQLIVKYKAMTKDDK